MTERVSRPAQDILFPQTHRRTRKMKRRGTWRWRAAIHPRTETNKNLTLHWIFLILLVFVLSPCIIMFTSCVYVIFSKMYALFIFLPKPLYCASIISLLMFICLTVHIVNLLISIWMFCVFQSAFIDSTVIDILKMSVDSIPHCDSTYYLCFTHYYYYYLINIGWGKKCCFW